MPGRDSHEEDSEDRYTAKRRAALNGTGKHPILPQGTGKYSALPQGTGKYDSLPRPQNGRRIEAPPVPRVARPHQEKPRRRGRLLLVVLGVFLAGALLACYFGYIAFNYLNGLNAGSGAAMTANDFLQSVSTQNYEQAYIDLGGDALQVQNLEQFKDKALRDDTCYGIVKNYQEVSGSATVQGSTQSYSYTITRSKLSAPYQLHLTLQQGENSSDTWKVISYGDDLGPAPPKC